MLLHRCVQRRVYSGMITLLVLLLSYGKIVQGNCEDLYKYSHPNYAAKCLMCRICPEYIVTDERLFRLYRQPLCGNLTLPDGRKVQCSGSNFDVPSCPLLKPHVGHVECRYNNTVYSTCQLHCPSGFVASKTITVKCLALPIIHWDTHLPYCKVQNNRNKDRDSLSQTKHAPKVLSVIAIIFLAFLFLICPWLILICLIQWKEKETLHQRQANQAQNVVQLVKIKLSNANQTQRCYVLRNKWIAKKGTNVTVSALSKTCSVTKLVVIKREAGRSSSQIYSSLPSAPNEIVLHNISLYHKGQYDWITYLSNNKTECGTFHLDLKTPSLKDNGLNYIRQCSTEIYYQELHQEEESEGAASEEGSGGFYSLMKNKRDVERLCVLFDQDERSGSVSWHTIAMSPLINYDRQAVNNDEYHLKGKAGYQGPTYKMLTKMHQNGTSAKDFVDFLKQHLCSSTESVQIMNKYL